MFKNIIFDWSGVINDDTHSDYKAIIAVLKHFGGPDMTFEEFREKWELPFMNFYNKYIPNANLTAEEQFPVYDKYIKQYKNPKLYKGLNLTIKKLMAYKKFNLNYLLASIIKN